MKLCLFCKRFAFDSADPAYSEHTPGIDVSIWCIRDHWSVNIYQDDDVAFRRYMATAQTCPDYELSDDAREMGVT